MASNECFAVGLEDLIRNCHHLVISRNYLVLFRVLLYQLVTGFLYTDYGGTLRCVHGLE